MWPAELGFILETLFVMVPAPSMAPYILKVFLRYSYPEGKMEQEQNLCNKPFRVPYKG